MSNLRNLDDAILAGGDKKIKALRVLKDWGRSSPSLDDSFVQEIGMILPLPENTTLQHISFAAQAKNTLVVLHPSGSTLSFATARAEKLIWEEDSSIVLQTQNALYELLPEEDTRTKKKPWFLRWKK